MHVCTRVGLSRTPLRRLVGVAAIAMSIVICSSATASADVVRTVPSASLLVGVSCATPSDCVAVGQAGAQQTGVVVPTTGKSASVQQVAGTNELYGIDCPTATSCIAVGVGNSASNGVVVPITNDVAAGATTVGQTAFLRGVACATATFCVAVGWQTGNFNGANARIGVVVPVVNGSPGGVELISGTLGLEGVACETSTSCVAVGTGTGGNGVVVPIASGTAGGVQTVAGTADFKGVACGSATSCTAVGPGPGLAGDGVVVPIDNGIAGGAEPIPGGGLLWGVSCGSVDTCWAAGSGGSAGADGGFWPIDSALGPRPPRVEPGTSRLYGVACTANVSCVGVGQAPPLGSGPGAIAAFGPVEGPWKLRDIAAAKADLPLALQSAASFCTPHALGLVGFGTGVLMIGSVPTLAIAGLITAYATQPFCLAVVTRVLRDYRRYMDPPASQIGKLAGPAPVGPVSLPSCRRWHGMQRVFCKQLESAEGKWARAAEQVAAIGVALATTQAREASALAAGNQSAVNLQDGHIHALERQLRAPLAGQLSAGKAIARILKAHHVGFRMTKAQSGRAISAVERTLAKQGLRLAVLRQLAGGALRPRAVNLLRVLAG